MQSSQKLNWLGRLTVLGALAAGLAQGDPLTVNSGNIAPNQDGAGTDIRIRYDALSDAYYLNTNTSTPWVMGLGTGLTWPSQYFVRTVDVIDTKQLAYIKRDGTNALAELRWTFNFPRPIEKISIINTSAAWPIDGHFSQVEWSASVDGGTTWKYYDLIKSGTTGSVATDGGDANDLTAFAAGKTSLLLRVMLGDWQNGTTDQQIFRTGSGADWGLDMKVSVPEPASLALLMLGGLCLLRRRRS